MNKLNKYIEKNIINIITFIILSQPFVDIIVGFSNQFNIYTSIISLIRMFILFFIIYYVFLVGKSNLKKRFFLIFLIILSYIISHLIIINTPIIYDLKMMMRSFYFPLLFLLFFLIKEEKGNIINQKHLLYSLGMYALVIVVGMLTNTAFRSYTGVKLGTSGYFYAANEISNIIAILLPLVFNYVFNNPNFKKIIYFILIISSIFILGTKTPFISLVLCSIYFFIKSLNHQNIIKTTFISIIILIIVMFSISFTPIYKNTIIHLSFLKLNNLKQIVKDKNTFDHFALGSRLEFLNKTTITFNGVSYLEKLFGLGYFKGDKLVEMDYHDILYRQGLIGFMLYFMTIFYIFFFKEKKYKKEYIFSILLAIFIAGIVGHIITAPAVSFFVVCLLSMYNKEGQDEGKYNSSRL